MGDLTKIPIVVSEALAGQSKAVMLNGTLSVSPAMWQLMDGASPEELEHLLKHIAVIDLGSTPSLFEPIKFTPELR